jgi:hypothetical protein
VIYPFDSVNEERLRKKQKSHDISGDEKEALNKLKQIISKSTNGTLEIMATVCYLIHEKKADWSNVYDALKTIKPKVKDKDMVLGINDAKIWLITKEEWTKALEDFRDEIGFWDKASASSMDPYLE